MKPEQAKRNVELAILLGQAATKLHSLAGAISTESRRGEILPATIGQMKAIKPMLAALTEAADVFNAENATGPSPLYHGQGN